MTRIAFAALSIGLVIASQTGIAMAGKHSPSNQGGKGKHPVAARPFNPICPACTIVKDVKGGSVIKYQ